jgi:hypothetical protein
MAISVLHRDFIAGFQQFIIHFAFNFKGIEGYINYRTFVKFAICIFLGHPAVSSPTLFSTASGVFGLAAGPASRFLFPFSGLLSEAS